MNISLDQKEKCLTTINVEVPAETVTQERNKILNSLASTARIRGFRPGKAPKSIVEKTFLIEINERLDKTLISNAFQQVLKDHEDLDILSTSALKDPKHQPDGSFVFTVDLITRPTFDLPEYKGLNLTIPLIEVDDEVISSNLESLRQRFADYEEITDRSAEKNDLAVIDFTSTIDGQPLDEVAGPRAKPLASNTGYWVRIDDEAFFPGFTDALIGAKVGDELEIPVTLPTEFPIESIREKEALFSVKLTGLKTEILPELDDAFASKLEPGKTLEELKNLIRLDLEGRAEEHRNRAKVEAVSKALTHLVDFELPSELVQEETQRQADAMVEEGLEAGMTEDQVDEHQRELFAEAKERAIINLKLRFILAKIADGEQIEVQQQQLVQTVTRMAKQAKRPLKPFIKELQKDGRIRTIQENLVFSNTLDFLVEEANFTEEKQENE